jgi:hypothetical protein
MLLREIVEMAIRLPDGGVISDLTRYDYDYMEAAVNVFSRRLLKLNYLKNKRINPVCYQKHWPQYEEDLQDDKCCVKFRHPEVITFDDSSDGFRYIGTEDYSKNFIRVKSRAWLSTFNDNQVTAVNNDRRITVLYDGNLQILEVMGSPLFKKPMTESVLADPTSIPTFNKMVDQYPFPNDLIPDLMNMMLSEQTGPESSKPISTNKRS